ncbi:hypothetical protein [Mesorhizobium sp. M1405]|uniref:hypothetical protein n=1 Tax=Mesorhizobium sp. M1405 TaxID=2957098 RepID=UPI0033376E83
MVDASDLVDMLPSFTTGVSAKGQAQPVVGGAKFDTGGLYAVAYPRDNTPPARTQAATAIEI